MHDLDSARSPPAVVSSRIHLRQKSNFASRFNAILPVQSCREKYSDFVFSEIGVPCSRPALDQEGRFAIVTNVERGMRWTHIAERNPCADERCLCGRRSRVVLALRRRRQGREDALASHGRRWQPSMVTEESAKETVKTTAQGRPVVRLVPVVPAPCISFARGPWVRPASGLPCALLESRGRVFRKARARWCREVARVRSQRGRER